VASRSPTAAAAPSRSPSAGFLLMPSAYLWPYVAAITELPWLPTIVYPATGIAELWQAPPAPPETLERLMGRTRALVLTAVTSLCRRPRWPR